MANSTATKKALWSSIVALLLCFTMLMGATFAWFTDNVSSTGNRIQAGNLEVDLVMYKNDGTTSDGYVSIGGDDGDIFSEAGDGVWEPGKTQIVYLGVRNNGNLALKYDVLLNIIDNGLVGSLEYAILDGVKAGEITETDWEALKNRADAQTGDIAAGLTPAAQNGVLDEIALSNEEFETDFFALAVHMKEEAGNEYENDSIVIDLVLNATQKNAEVDSFGPDYDIDAEVESFPVSSVADLEMAIASGATSVTLTEDVGIDAPINISSDLTINGNGSVLERADDYTGVMFNVTNGADLTLNDIVLDGGAIWNSGSTLSLRSSNVLTNTGATATGSLVVVPAGSTVTLGSDVVIMNNDGASAVNNSGTLIIDGAEITNNRAAGGGAVWNAGTLIINSGKINNNHADIGGAIRMTTGKTLIMNGGEMNHNTAATTGGAIYGYTRENCTFNGGEMAYNTAGTAGGAIWSGTYAPYTIAGDFEMHDNSDAQLGGAIRFSDHASLTMTGGKVYNNTTDGESYAFFLNNNTATITGGEISDDFSYAGGLGLTVGKADITGTIRYNLGTNHKTAYLASEWNGFKFTVEEAHIATFNFKPAADYTYVAGDEAKLVCQNSGYKTYWDAATSTFRLMAE
ncbi:MAG: hypothetical protein IKM21_00860 [Oscillospiraceae bacterium]|nr:hypothetical protein [Oscillospiraceae bacterium]